MSDEETRGFPEGENNPENNDDMMYVQEYDFSEETQEDASQENGNPENEMLEGYAEKTENKEPDDTDVDEVKYEIREKVSEKSGRGLITTIFIFLLIGLLAAGVLLSLKNVMPGIMLNRADKYMEKGEYQKALNLYTMASNARPLEVRPVVGQVKALAKLPMTYENQKMLYEISQLDDYDEATELAENVLTVVREELNKKIGSNYVDNILFEGQLLRWNKSEPLTYSVGYNENVPEHISNASKEAFGAWSNAMNGEISFKETHGNPNANIVVHYSAPERREEYQHAFFGVASIPYVINDEVLKRVDIYINPFDREGHFLDFNNIYNMTMHQIGHALGLWGHSAAEEDLMSYNHEQAYPDAEMHVITSRDVNTLKAVYNMVPDVIDKPLKRDETHTMNYHRILTTYPGENYKREMERIIAQLRFNRRNIIAWVDLAINDARMKQYERSNYILKKIEPLVLDDYDNQFVIFYNIAANYYKMKKYDSSRRYLEYAREIDIDLDTQILDAFLDYKTGKIDLAKEELKGLFKNHPDNIEIALKLAEIYFVKQDRKSEKAVIEELIKHNPDAKKDRRVVKYIHERESAIEEQRTVQTTNENAPVKNKEKTDNNEPPLVTKDNNKEYYDNDKTNEQTEYIDNENQNPQPEDFNNQRPEEEAYQNQ